MAEANQDQLKAHYCQIGREQPYNEDIPPDEKAISDHRRRIEPWLSAVFQSEHLSLLLGNGFTRAVSISAGLADVPGMDKVGFGTEFDAQIDAYAKQVAAEAHRGDANIEDQIRSAGMLAGGFSVMGDKAKAEAVDKAISAVVEKMVKSILSTEAAVKKQIEEQTEDGQSANRLLCSFLLSFASRTATRERLHVFTTNYDRFIEYGCDWTGLRIVDRFVGYLSPIFRSSRIDVDIHYNPPGIRGEPRYLEGVIKLTKLHGSLDWRILASVVRRVGIGFGAEATAVAPTDCVLIYPNAAKDVETTEYPYADLFRDCAAALCRPNSALVTYGYGFGDGHVNRVIRDMLTIPSTHLVVISWDDPGRAPDKPGRIEQFCMDVGRPAQITLLVGSHFGSLSNLVDHYLPKPAIDYITKRQTQIKLNRGELHVPPAERQGPTISVMPESQA